jgi:hypothetical protein
MFSTSEHVNRSRPVGLIKPSKRTSDVLLIMLDNSTQQFLGLGQLSDLLKPPNQLCLLSQLLPTQLDQSRITGQTERGREANQRRLMHLSDLGRLTDTAEGGRLRIGQQDACDAALPGRQTGHSSLQLGP